MSKPNGPWFRVPKATASVALDHGGSNMLLLLVALQWIENDRGEMGKPFPASATLIARRSGLSTRTIERLLPQIQGTGLVQILSGKGTGMNGGDAPNRFILQSYPSDIMTDTLRQSDAPRPSASCAELAGIKEQEEPKEKEGLVGKEAKNIKTQIHELPPIPAELDTPAFRVAWGEWIQHRKEKGKPLTPSTASKQLKEVSAWGKERAIAAIDYSILKGWQGIFENPNHTPMQEQVVPSIPKAEAPEGWEETLKELYPNATDISWDLLTQLHPDVADQVKSAITHAAADAPAIAQKAA